VSEASTAVLNRKKQWAPVSTAMLAAGGAGDLSVRPPRRSAEVPLSVRTGATWRRSIPSIGTNTPASLPRLVTSCRPMVHQGQAIKGDFANPCLGSETGMFSFHGNSLNSLMWTSLSIAPGQALQARGGPRTIPGARGARCIQDAASQGGRNLKPRIFSGGRPHSKTTGKQWSRIDGVCAEIADQPATILELARRQCMWLDHAGKERPCRRPGPTRVPCRYRSKSSTENLGPAGPPKLPA